MSIGPEASMPQTNTNLVIRETPKVSNYEQCREDRIKENLQRMQNLGILNLSRKLKSEIRPVKRQCRKSNSGLKSTPSRRSSRLENSTPVNYTHGIDKKNKTSKQENPVIDKDTRLNKEEHEKLLGNTERNWTSFVDGYDKNGKRIYDPVKGKTCHQCRQKTLGHRTRCSRCDMVQGQFCGDCLFKRYGEHVLEALENPNWICPVCRGICNCSLCRNRKGLVPTGPIYRKVAKLGYKSVAHYLIQTERSETDDTTPNQASAKRSLSFHESKPFSGIPDGDDQEGDFLKKDVDENPNSTKRSLSFLLANADDEASLMDVEVIGYLEPPLQDKQEQSLDDLPTGQNSITRQESQSGL